MRATAPAALNTESKTLVPFATQAQAALTNLGNAAQQSESSLVGSQPLVNQLGDLGRAALARRAVAEHAIDQP